MMALTQVGHSSTDNFVNKQTRATNKVLNVDIYKGSKNQEKEFNLICFLPLDMSTDETSFRSSIILIGTRC